MTRLFTTYGGSRIELGSRVGAETRDDRRKGQEVRVEIGD
jgi:hypothetical protein